MRTTNGETELREFCEALNSWRAAQAAPKEVRDELYREVLRIVYGGRNG
ncbi:hypothetical protein [Ferrimicrobium sp.]|nr:hypothetical protein [Ferrimicrobium sp.]